DLHYTLPTPKEIDHLFKYKITSFDTCFTTSKEMINAAKGLSHAEIARVCDDAIKNSILNDIAITNKAIIELLNERHDIYTCKEA
ncbi:ATPase, partial [Enterocloster clostridioformis]|nr:ATPase [Enterocloster clostridioformis]